jgi:HAD superfamily hydrolase (TIGR01509 family)
MAAVSQKQVKAVVFDLDGTLVDTEPTAASTVIECFREWRIEVSPEDARYTTGRTWAIALEFLFSKYSIPVPKDEAVEIVLDRYRREMARELRTVEGAVDCVRALAPHYPLALVSGSHRAEILFALEKLGVLPLFKVILGAEDYPRSKPAPDGYLKGLELLGVRGSDAVCFEDSDAGIASARSAGMWTVAITSTNHFGQDTRKAHVHVPNLKGIDAAWVEEFVAKARV